MDIESREERRARELAALARKRLYVGIRKTDSVYELFRASRHDCCGFDNPIHATHGHLYAAVIGPFRTLKGARYMEQYGRGNPHLQTVDDAERLARLNDQKAA